MNKWIGCGRLCADPELKYSQTNTDMAIARYTLVVERKVSKDQEKKTDFIRCIAFGKSGEFASKYFHKGLRVLVEGRLQIGSYTNKDGVKIPTADIIIESQEFADGKREGATESTAPSLDTFEDSTNEDEIPF